MKKLFAFLILTLFVTAFAFAQQNSSAVQKHALVIGNGKYASFGSLRNAVNDAEDVASALAGLGFTVEKIIDGNRNRIENAAVNLRNKLRDNKNSYGFFFYAGHGVQHNGVNYLIPVDADIPDSDFLRDRAVSVQAILDMLNKTNNALNIVVLDACRDLPSAWSRSADRGLAVVHPPTDSIIMYATAAGKTASDGTGRNGLFTANLLTHLKTPGIEVKDVFYKTMSDVAKASKNEQRPALYTDFSETAYLGAKPSGNTAAVTPKPATGAAAVVTPAVPAAEPAKPAVAATGGTVKDYISRGKSFYNKKDYDSAILEFTEAIKLDKNNSEAFYERGRSYLAKKEYSNAVDDYTQVIRIDPKSSSYTSRAFLYHQMKEYDKALADYTKAINIDPNSSLLYMQRSHEYRYMKEYDKAIADITYAIKLDPKSVPSHESRARTYREMKDYKKAIADYTAAIKLEPNNDSLYFWRGDIYFENKNYDKAIADLSKAISLAPNDPNNYGFRGEVYEAKGDKKKAEADYQKAKELRGK